MKRDARAFERSRINAYALGDEFNQRQKALVHMIRLLHSTPGRCSGARKGLKNDDGDGFLRFISFVFPHTLGFDWHCILSSSV